MLSIAAWVGLPIALLVLCTGIGLLAERIVRAELPPGLLAPAGACLGIVAVVPGYALGAGWIVGAVVLVAAALTGLVVARRRLRARLAPGAAHLAGLLAYGLHLAPVVLAGGWTWLGYNFVNDTANNMVFVEHVAAHGFTAPADPTASTTTRIIAASVDSHYPLGLFALLASLRGMLGLPTEAAYQPFIAALAGLAAMSFAVLLRRVGVSAPWAAGTALLAAGASLTYNYALHGAIKEIALLMVLGTAAALGRHALDEGWRLGLLALGGAVLAAGLIVISAAAAPYAALTGGVLVLAALGERRRIPLPRLAAGVLVAGTAFALAAAPVILEALSFLRSTAPAFEGEGGLSGNNSTVIFGHLAGPLPLEQALGIWPTDDYRFGVSGPRWPLTQAAMVVAGALIAVTAAVELRRRRLGALLLVLPAFGAYLIAAPRLTPYADAKLLVLLSPTLVLAAGLGAWHLHRRVPLAGAAGATVLAVGVLASDALAYHSVRLAPTERLRALEDAAEHATAPGPWLHNEWEEFSKYFERGIVNNNATESYSPAPVVLREDEPMFARTFDLDRQALEYVQQFPGLILRRSPSRSRPPANFEQVYSNEYYELWRRQPRPKVREHLSLQGLDDSTRVPRCADIRAMALRADAAGEALVAAQRPEPVRLDPTLPGKAPLGWNPGPSDDVLVPGRPGRVRSELAFDAGGYDIWVRGSSGRELEVDVDGRTVGAAVGVNTPAGWLHAGSVRIQPGVHTVSLTRPGGSLAPGDGYAGEIGAVAFVPRDVEPELVEISPDEAERRLCRRSWDWVERVAS